MRRASWCALRYSRSCGGVARAAAPKAPEGTPIKETSIELHHHHAGGSSSGGGCYQDPNIVSVPPVKCNGYAVNMHDVDPEGWPTDAYFCDTCGRSMNSRPNSWACDATLEEGYDKIEGYNLSCGASEGELIGTTVSGGWDGMHYYLTFSTNWTGHPGGITKYTARHLDGLGGFDYEGSTESIDRPNHETGRVEIFANGDYLLEVTYADYCNREIRISEGYVHIDDYGYFVFLDPNGGRIAGNPHFGG